MPNRAHHATFRFYAELRDFLPPGPTEREIEYGFDGSPSIKDAIEAQGIPHTEVDLILVNGSSVDFHYRLQSGDRVAVYPVFETLDITPVVRLRPAPLRDLRFVVDVNLGQLARLLRLLGFDVVYHNDLADAAIVALAVREHRVVLTRDRLLLHHKVITHGYWVRSPAPETQAAEVLRRFQLEGCVQPFTRCLECNGRVTPVAKETVATALEPKTALYYDQFFRCEQCGRIYWQGSHYARLLAKVERILRR